MRRPPCSTLLAPRGAFCSVKRIWLLFAQATTVALGVFFVVSTLRPDLLGRGAGTTAVVTVRETSAPTSAAATSPASYRTASAKASAAVVNIFTSKVVRAPRHPLLDDPFFRRFFGDRFEESPRQQASSLGSGVIVSPSGHILTNHHVVEAADEIEVALADGRKLVAEIVGTDPDTDLAVLQVKAGNLSPITFGHPEQLKVGDVVLAIGNPFGVGQTVTMGIVSALGRSHLGINTFENFIQTDAAINPGNSGGALVDTAGDLVGINSAIYSQSGGSMGIGFAIPANLARQVMEQIVSNGTVTRGWIGVEVQELTRELAESFNLSSTEGALIARVMPGGPADRGGVRSGDILVAVQGRPVADSAGMLNLVAALEPGKAATLRVQRGGRTLDLGVTVGRRPAPVDRAARP